MTKNKGSNDFSDIVYGRKSVRVYDEKVKIPKDEILEILQKATRAPSAVNMQSWRFVVVDSEEGKNRLKPFIFRNTSQNDSSAAMILILGDLECYEYGQEIYDKAVNENKMTAETREAQLSRIIPIYQNFTEEHMQKVVTIDAGLVAMQLMLVARSYGYDTCPITGFKSEGLVEALDLDSSRYYPVMMVSMGEALEDGYDTVRIDAEQITYFK
ncbi:nitroreductase family protein [Alkalibacterium kapii]|uniref:Nitroreductase domain-containing protein n=1 Tax=Alkalibacterium kapii TaxID=426704 RepID=A0A511AUG2_9LACT|nr:nitroreductase family protein [Alkalibacterium kapii]GEK91829.1 hypothetical protein AKA01nite_14510 [Alkalibacterium kapii]